MCTGGFKFPHHTSKLAAMSQVVLVKQPSSIKLCSYIILHTEGQTSKRSNSNKQSTFLAGGGLKYFKFHSFILQNLVTYNRHVFLALPSPLSSSQLRFRSPPRPRRPSLQQHHVQIPAAAVKHQVPQSRGPVQGQKPTPQPGKGLAHLLALLSTW